MYSDNKAISTNRGIKSITSCHAPSSLFKIDKKPSTTKIRHPTELSFSSHSYAPKNSVMAVCMYSKESNGPAFKYKIVGDRRSSTVVSAEENPIIK